MYSDQMQFERQPFQSQVDTAFFFSDGSRRDVVEGIKRALLERVSLLTLTGTEGSGKTMICRMVEQELEGENFHTLFIDQSVESFDDVMGLTAESIGLVHEETDSKTRIIQVADALQEKPKRLVIILDGAERMYLATLERIRRMLDEVNEDRVVIQILFSGRPLFLVSFKKLAIVSFKDIEERHFSLDPLDAETTHAYLNHCVDIAAGKKLDHFSADVAQVIAHDARGNFGLINQLADGYLKTGRIAGSGEIRIPEDLDDGLAGADTLDFRSRLSARLNRVDLDFLKVPQIRARYYLLVGAVLLAGLLIFLYGTDSGTDRENTPETPPVPVLELDKAEPLETPPPLKEQEIRPVEQLQPVDKRVAAKQIEDQQADAKALEEPEQQKVETLPEPPAAQPSPEPAEQQAEPAPEPAEKQAEFAPEPADSGTAEDNQEIKTTPPEAAQEAQDQITEAIRTRDKVFPSEASQDRPMESAGQQVEQPEPTEQPVQSAEEPMQRQEAVVAEQPKAPVVEREEVSEAGTGEQQAAAEQVSEEARAISESPSDAEAEAMDKEVEQIPTSPPIVVSQQKQKRQLEAPVVITLQGAKKVPADIPEEALPAEKPVSEQVPEKKTLPEVSPQPVSLSDALVPKTVAEQNQVQRQPVQTGSEQQQEVEAKTPPQLASAAVPTSKQSPEQEELPIDVSSFYAERIAAGARWLVGAGRDKYTVQLMVLRSDEAEDNLKALLTASNYQDFRQRLYILRRAGLPQTVMLFFGEFDTQAQADQARNELPESLITLNPYAISIKEAVEKAKSGR
jgi:type II secretory pathway predicted ATPase ExeA